MIAHRLLDKYARGEPITIENFVIETINSEISAQIVKSQNKRVSLLEFLNEVTLIFGVLAASCQCSRSDGERKRKKKHGKTISEF